MSVPMAIWPSRRAEARPVGEGKVPVVCGATSSWSGSGNRSGSPTAAPTAAPRQCYLNNRAENSTSRPGSGTSDEQVPLPGSAQRFLSAFSGISPHFRPRRHRLIAAQHRHEMNTRFTAWNEVVGLRTAPLTANTDHTSHARTPSHLRPPNNLTMPVRLPNRSSNGRCAEQLTGSSTTGHLRNARKAGGRSADGATVLEIPI